MAAYRFSDLPKPVEIVAPPAIGKMISALLPGWSITAWDTGEQVEPVLRLSFQAPDLVVNGHWAPQEIRRKDPVDAVCGFIAELIRAYVNEVSGQFCLHAAAVYFGESLVVFPSTHRAGKSILCSALAAAGNRLAGDDIIMIDAADGCGIAGGFCPRLRLPLPDNLEPATRAFIEARSGPSGRNYLYLNLDETILARKGERAPVCGIVLLDRREDQAATLEPIGPAEALKTVIFQNFARQEPPPIILRRLHELVKNAATFRLTFSRTEECIGLLSTQFREKPDAGGNSRLPRGPDLSASPDVSAPQSRPANTGIEATTMAYHRNPEISELEIDGQRFLADSRSGLITHLNEAASAVWHALNEPMSEENIIDLMQTAFPEIERATIAADVQRVLTNLVGSGHLIEPRGESENV